MPTNIQNAWIEHVFYINIETKLNIPNGVVHLLFIIYLVFGISDALHKYI